MAIDSYYPTYPQRRYKRLSFVFSSEPGVPHGIYWVEAEEGSCEGLLRNYVDYRNYWIRFSNARIFDAQEVYNANAIEIDNCGNRYRLSLNSLHYGGISWEDIYKDLTRNSLYLNPSDICWDNGTINTLTSAACTAAMYGTAIYKQQAYNSPLRVESGLLREEVNPMNLEIGKKYRITVTNSNGASRLQGQVRVITRLSGSSFYHTKEDGTGEEENNIGNYSFEEIKEPKIPMPNTDEIPKSLSVMERITATPEEKTLIKAGYLANGELTQKAKDMISVLQFKTYEADLVKAAQEELDEVTAAK